MYSGTRDITQVVKYLVACTKPCVLLWEPYKPDMTAHACTHRTWELETKESEVQIIPITQQVPSQFTLHETLSQKYKTKANKTTLTKQTLTDCIHALDAYDSFVCGLFVCVYDSVCAYVEARWGCQVFLSVVLCFIPSDCVCHWLRRSLVSLGWQASELPRSPVFPSQCWGHRHK